jgi:hypothetical protein
MSNIIAKNIANGLQREFTKLQWDLLGNNKGNWVDVNADKGIALETGDKIKKDIEVNNIEVLEEVSIKDSPVIFEDAKQKESFYQACVNINKGRLKDFLDKNGIKYEQDNKVKELIEVLGKAYNYDKQIVKENF